MNSKTESSHELSIKDIERSIEKQTNRINKGITFLVLGIIITITTIDSPVQIIWYGAILYGIAEIINGNSLKSRYKKMMPTNLLPPKINCNNCGELLELDMDERVSQEYFCPICNQKFSYNVPSRLDN